MDRLSRINPFAKRDEHSSTTVTTYKVLSLLSWLLSVVTTVYYASHAPGEPGPYPHRSIWEQNDLWPSGFTLNHIITDVYWVVLFALQLVYTAHLFSTDVATVNAACSVGSHFIFNNLLHSSWVLLFVHSRFIWSEIFLIANFVNLSALYFRHNAYARFIHAPAVSGPLAWTFVAIYWNGAIAVCEPENLVARIFANVFVWSVLVYGLFFIFAYKDYTMGFALSVLSASLGVGQLFTQAVALQWIFAFTIMSVLFVFTLLVAVPAWTGRDLPWAARREPSDAERAPLLAE